MTEKQINELAERLRSHLAKDGSFYGFERVITNWLKSQPKSKEQRLLRLCEKLFEEVERLTPDRSDSSLPEWERELEGLRPEPLISKEERQ